MADFRRAALSLSDCPKAKATADLWESVELREHRAVIRLPDGYVSSAVRGLEKGWYHWRWPSGATIRLHLQRTGGNYQGLGDSDRMCKATIAGHSAQVHFSDGPEISSEGGPSVLGLEIAGFTSDTVQFWATAESASPDELDSLYAALLTLSPIT